MIRSFAARPSLLRIVPVMDTLLRYDGALVGYTWCEERCILNQELCGGCDFFFSNSECDGGCGAATL